jgi:hypothetical protein
MSDQVLAMKDCLKNGQILSEGKQSSKRYFRGAAGFELYNSRAEEVLQDSPARKIVDCQWEWAGPPPIHVT